MRLIFFTLIIIALIASSMTYYLNSSESGQITAMTIHVEPSQVKVKNETNESAQSTNMEH